MDRRLLHRRRRGRVRRGRSAGHRLRFRDGAHSRGGFEKQSQVHRCEAGHPRPADARAVTGALAEATLDDPSAERKESMNRFRSLSARCLVIVGALSLTAAAPAFGGCSGDADCDGVLDAFDLCPTTPALEFVSTSGCSLCPCEGPAAGGAWASHTAYVNCAPAAANQLSLAEHLTQEQTDQLISLS